MKPLPSVLCRLTSVLCLLTSVLLIGCTSTKVTVDPATGVWTLDRNSFLQKAEIADITAPGGFALHGYKGTTDTEALGQMAGTVAKLAELYMGKLPVAPQTQPAAPAAVVPPSAPPVPSFELAVPRSIPHGAPCNEPDEDRGKEEDFKVGDGITVRIVGVNNDCFLGAWARQAIRVVRAANGNETLIVDDVQAPSGKVYTFYSVRPLTDSAADIKQNPCEFTPGMTGRDITRVRFTCCDSQ